MCNIICHTQPCICEGCRSWTFSDLANWERDTIALDILLIKSWIFIPSIPSPVYFVSNSPWVHGYSCFTVDAFVKTRRFKVCKFLRFYVHLFSIANLKKLWEILSNISVCVHVHTGQITRKQKHILVNFPQLYETTSMSPLANVIESFSNNY